jgi:hypothetical protein
MKVLNHLDLVQNEVRNARLQNLATAPTSPAVGQIYFDTTLGFARVWEGAAWQRADASAAVTSVGATAPIASSGGATPTISISAATDSAAGSMSATDKAKLDAATATDTASTLVLRDSNKRFRAADPSDAQDVATKTYVDNKVTGLDVKNSVRAATTESITLSGAQTVDGVSVIAGDRVLVKNQSSAENNGIYVAASGAWSRSDDADSNAEVTPNLFVFVEEGTANADSGWTLTNNGAITLGTTELAFTQFTGAGQVVAGDGLTKSANTLNVGGTADRITVGSDTVDIASTYVGQASITTLGTVATGTWSASTIAVDKGGTGATDAAGARTNLGATTKYSATIGNNSATDIAVTHNLGSRDVSVTVYETGTPYAVVYPDIEMTSTSVVTIKFSTAPTTDAYRVVIVA